MFCVPIIISTIVKIALFLVGIVLFLFGLDFLFFPTIFKCDKLKNICYTKSRRIWAKKAKRQNPCKLSDVKCATVDSFVIGSIKMYHVVLELQGGTSLTIFNTASSTRPEHEKQAEKINNFLKHGHKEMVLKNPFYFEGILFTILGVLISTIGILIKLF